MYKHEPYERVYMLFLFYFEGFTSFPTALTANDRTANDRNPRAILLEGFIIQ